jgi:hypothetical protein
VGAGNDVRRVGGRRLLLGERHFSEDEVVNKVADIASVIVTLAIVTVLVAPRSQGPNFVSAIGSAFSSSIQAANSPSWAK